MFWVIVIMVTTGGGGAMKAVVVDQPKPIFTSEASCRDALRAIPKGAYTQSADCVQVSRSQLMGRQ